MDISQAWPFLEALLIGLAGWTIFHFAKRIRRRLTRIFIKTLAGCLVVGGAVAVSFLFLGDIVFVKFAPPIYSPDRRHVVVHARHSDGAHLI